MLQEVVEDYITSLSNREYERGSGSRNTSMAYRNDLNQLCSYLMGQEVSAWSQVSREQIAAYLLALRDGSAYRPTTIARKIAALKSFFRYLLSKELIKVDPIEKLEAPHVRKDLPHILAVEQIENLFAQVNIMTPVGLRDYAMLQMLYATGMRASELVSLEVEDVDLERALVICMGRSDARRDRVLPLSEVALDAIRAYLEHGRSYLLRYPAEQHALFLNHHGERLTRQGFWLIIKGYARHAGIARITPHMLRHSFAISMLQSGMALSEVQALLGHAHISTTQVYSQLFQVPADPDEEKA